MGSELDSYVSALTAREGVRVRVLRMPKREGLVKARLMGAREATAPTLTFLDAHCEASRGWLEPLMAAVANDRTNVPCPVIDGVDADSFAYNHGSGGANVGIFGWSFGFHWSVHKSALMDINGCCSCCCCCCCCCCC